MTFEAQMILPRVQQLNRGQSTKMCELIKQGCDATVALILVEKAYSIPDVCAGSNRTATMGRAV
jgi:hypothetical protein